MAEILSLKRHDGHQAIAALGWTPDAAHSGYAGLFQLVPDHPGTEIDQKPIILMRRLALRTAQNDRIVTMVDPINAHDTLFLIAVLIVSHPFAVGAFFIKLVRRNETFESDLGLGRNRQTGDLAVDDFNGLAAHASCPIELALAVDRTLGARSQKQQRVGADDGDQRAGLSALHIFFLDDAAMVRWRGADADTVLVEYLVAIGADVDTAGVGIAHNIEARGADVPTAVAWVPDRRRE